MSPQAGRFAFGLGVWVGALAVAATLLSAPGSAERLVSVAGLVVSAVYLAVVVWVVRRSR